MQRYRLTAIGAVMIGSLMFNGCKKAPTDLMESSRASLDAASAASQCATEEYRRAESLFEQARAAMEDKDYDRAEELATQAQEEAQRAMDVAQANPYYPECDLAEGMQGLASRAEQALRNAGCAPDEAAELEQTIENGNNALEGRDWDRLEELVELGESQLEAFENAAQDNPDWGHPNCEPPEPSDSGDGAYDWTPVQFGFDSFAIDRSGRRILDDHADHMSENEDVDITIEGYCSEEGTPEYNIALGLRRAEAARRYLQDRGVESSRIQTTSFGEENPVDRANPSANRRDEFRLR